MTSPQLDPQLVINLQAAWRTECLAFASTALVIWDHAITFDQEVELFWTRDWSVSGVLYLTIRYLALALGGLSYYIYSSVPQVASTRSLAQYVKQYSPVIHVGYILVFVLVLLCQAVVALRVWYLFSRNRVVRFGSMVLYCGSIISCSILGAREWSAVKQEFEDVANIFVQSRLTAIWFIFLPCLIVHSILFMCKIWRVVESRHSWNDTPVMRTMLKEGALMYTFATGSLIWSIVGLSDVTNPLFYQPALLGDFAVAAAAISVCRSMLNIGSLAATWHVEPSWLLNHAELRRVHWRSNGHEREIVVEVGDVGDDDEAESETEMIGMAFQGQARRKSIVPSPFLHSFTTAPLGL